MSVTLKKIATMAKTSQATVSLVLNGKQFHRVSPGTRQRIQDIADLLNYQPNLKARALSSGKTKNIATIVKDLSNPFYSSYYSMLQARLETHGYTIFPLETRQSLAREEKLLNWLTQGYFDGCICLEYNQYNHDIYQKRQNAMPMVFRGWAGCGTKSDRIIKINYHSAIEALFRHFEDTGRRHLAITVDTNGKDENGREEDYWVRRNLYLEYCAKRNILLEGEVKITRTCDTGKNLDSIYRSTIELLTQNRKIDSLLVNSAQDVLAVYKAAVDTGRTIGSDLAVAAFDHIPQLSFLTPCTTHIVEPMSAVADALSEAVIAELENKSKVNKQYLFEAELVINESTPHK